MWLCSISSFPMRCARRSWTQSGIFRVHIGNNGDYINWLICLQLGESGTCQFEHVQHCECDICRTRTTTPEITTTTTPKPTTPRKKRLNLKRFSILEHSIFSEYVKIVASSFYTLFLVSIVKVIWKLKIV